MSEKPLDELLGELIERGGYFAVLFDLDGAAAEGEVAFDLEARFTPYMQIEFGDPGRASCLEIKDGKFNFDAPFYSTLGRSCYCSISLDRVLRVIDRSIPQGVNN